MYERGFCHVMGVGEMTTSDYILGLYSSRVIGGYVAKTVHDPIDWWKLCDPDLTEANCHWAIAEIWLESTRDDDDRVLLKQWMREE